MKNAGLLFSLSSIIFRIFLKNVILEKCNFYLFSLLSSNIVLENTAIELSINQTCPLIKNMR